MDDIMIITPEKTGWLIWIIWALIGLIEALMVQRMWPRRQMLAFNITIAVVAALIGGFLSVQFVGGTPMMLLFISILGAIFCAGIMLWIVGLLMNHFSKKQ